MLGQKSGGKSNIKSRQSPDFDGGYVEGIWKVCGGYVAGRFIQVLWRLAIRLYTKLEMKGGTSCITRPIIR